MREILCVTHVFDDLVKNCIQLCKNSTYRGTNKKMFLNIPKISAFF